MCHLATPARRTNQQAPAGEVSARAVILAVLAVFGMLLVILAYAAFEGGHHDANALAAEARLAAERGESIPAQVVHGGAATAGATR